jgi:hypothetical protein
VAPKKSQLFHWRQDVRQWLSDVLQYQRQSGLNVQIVAFRSKQSFPSSDLVVLAGQAVARGVAEWAVRTALRDAATSLGVTLDDADIEFLTELAMDLVLPAAA